MFKELILGVVMPKYNFMKDEQLHKRLNVA